MAASRPETSAIEAAVFVIKLSLVIRSNLPFAGHSCPCFDIEAARLVVEDAYQRQTVRYQGSDHFYGMFAMTQALLTNEMAEAVAAGF